jgi:DNA-binding MarR family transcriptional regulator
MSLIKPAGEQPATEAASIVLVQQAIRARALRAECFGGELFADPAWDILLDLFEAHLQYRHVYISALGAMAGIPPTTVLRWLKALAEKGLIVRSDDPLDGRRVFVSLSHAGVHAMEAYFRSLPTNLTDT